MYPSVDCRDPSRKKGVGLRDKSTGVGGTTASMDTKYQVPGRPRKQCLPYSVMESKNKQQRSASASPAHSQGCVESSYPRLRAYPGPGYKYTVGQSAASRNGQSQQAVSGVWAVSSPSKKSKPEFLPHTRVYDSKSPMSSGLKCKHNALKPLEKMEDKDSL